MELEWPMWVEIFCSHFKTILHLFFNCHYAMFLWTTIHIGFNINNIVGIYKNFIGLLDGRYQIIVWSYWHGHLHCLCTLATQVWSMSTKNYMHEAYVGGHQRRTKGVDDSCITYIGINGHANFLLHAWMDGVPLIELVNNVKLFFVWFLLHHMSVVLIVYTTHLCNS